MCFCVISDIVRIHQILKMLRQFLLLLLYNAKEQIKCW